MPDYRRLRVWTAGHRLVLEVYRASGTFPHAERFGLTHQIRTAALSIPSNLAEGSGRRSQKEFARFAKISLGSASELEYQLLLARDLGYLPADRHDGLADSVDHVKRMLSRLINAADRRAKAER